MNVRNYFKLVDTIQDKYISKTFKDTSYAMDVKRYNISKIFFCVFWDSFLVHCSFDYNVNGLNRGTSI